MSNYINGEWGETLQVTVEISSVDISTLSVNDADTNTATLRANVDDITLFDGDAAELWFRYRQVGDSTWATTEPSIGIVSTGEQTQSVAGLNDGVEYEAESRAQIENGDVVSGGLVTFETVEADVEYVFEGAVQDDQGAFVEGSTVELFIDGTPVGQATTDSSGSYTVLYTVQPSTLGSNATVEASSQNYVTNSVSFALDSGTTSYSQNVVIEREPVLSVSLLAVNDITDETATIRAEAQATNVSNVETRLDYREGSSGTVNEGIWQSGEGVIERPITGLSPETMYERRAVSRGDGVTDETTAWESFQTVAEDEEVYSFDGIIEGSDGPIQGAAVTLSIDGVQIGEQTTGSDGAYGFSHSQQPSELGQEATIEAVADGYDTKTKTVPLDSTVMTYLLDITLQVTAPEPPPPGDSVTPGDATDAATVIGTIGRKYYEGQRVPFTFSFRDANGPASPGFPITFRVSNRSGEVIDTHEFTSDDMEDGDTRLTFTYVLPAYGTMRFSVQSADGIVDVIRQYVHPNPA